ncbi:hypothetical protein [Bradyrhizobium diazoefficiens]|uniref:hypothetical protein n=1 Tax=Bradyrhizobium diazoefficiens TaxID=1355477 RepID=UPI00351917DD
MRVNPDVDAGTHAKITTGRADTKFGMSQRSAMMLARRTALQALLWSLSAPSRLSA